MDTSHDPAEYSIVQLLGMKNPEEVLERWRNDTSANKMPFNHTSSTQEMFLSSYIIGHKMREAGGKV
ncbi:unnamed protein product [Strongylus vulgaris]|uniref:Uncharacterized protein n=1 Tax=Strongylus vulgaris TaxID=40348 RepID=A0A3P7LSA9_STRVU|nr:unnamed protein product [Strongylus vulgaris]